MKIIAICLMILLAMMIGGCSHNLYNLKTLSPDGKYEVQIEEKAEMITEDQPAPYRVYLNAAEVGQDLIKNTVISNIGAMDQSFGKRYTDYSWAADNILWIGKLNPQSQPKPIQDQLLVKNNSTRNIRVLVIRAGRQIYFVLNLSPAKSVNLFPPQQAAPLHWIGATGYPDNGEDVWGSTDFEIPERHKGPGHYCISISNEKITTTSRDFKGYTTDESSLQESPGRNKKGEPSASTDTEIGIPIDKQPSCLP